MRIATSLCRAVRYFTVQFAFISVSNRVSSHFQERSLSYHEVNTMNEFQYLSPGKDPLKPEEVSMLKIFYRFLTSSSSATDGNKNALKEIALPRATGASTGSEIRSKCVHSTSELSCCEALSMEIENLKERVTQNEDFRRGVVQEVRDQRKFVQSHQNDISLLRIEIATMQQDLVDLQIEHNRLNDEVKRLLVLEDPFRIRHDLTNLITSIEVTQFKMQRLENRSQSLETMVRQLTGKIEKLLVPYGPDVVQSTP